MGRKKWGDFLFCTLLIYSPPPLSSPVRWGGWVEEDGKLTPPPLSSPVRWGG